MNQENEFIHVELSYEIIGCAFEAFKTVGVGFSELIYHKVFHDNLERRSFNAKYKIPAHLNYRSKNIADFEIDEIVEDKIVVELKEIQTDFVPKNFAQIITYLKLAELRLGLLINFGLLRAIPKRVIFDNIRKEDVENWDEGFFHNLPKKSTLDAIAASIRNVDKELGPGYHSKIYEAALRIEFDRNQITYSDQVHISFNFENIDLKPFEIDHWLINDSILFCVLAGKDEPSAYDLLRTRSYLRHLNLSHGLVVYWSTTNLQLCGLYNS